MWARTLITIFCLAALGASAQELAPINVENAAEIQQIGLLGFGVIEDIVWSPDGETVAVAGSLGLIFYDAEQFERAPAERWQLPEPRVYAVAFSPDGSTLATISGDLHFSREMELTFRLWDMDTGVIDSEWTEPLIANPKILFSPDGTELTIAHNWDSDGVRHWDVSDPKQVVALEPETWGDIQRRWYAPDSASMPSPYQLVFSPDGTTAAYIADCKITVVDANTGILRFSVEPHSYGCDQLLISPDGQLLVSTASSEFGAGVIQIWDINTGELILDAREGGIHALGFHPNQPAIVFKATYRGTVVHYWQKGMEKAETVLGQFALEQPNQFTDLDFNPDGSMLAAIHGGVVEFWDVRQGIKLRDDLYIEHVDNTWPPPVFTHVQFSPDGRLLALVGDNLSGQTTGRSIYLWDVQTSEFVGQIGYEYSLLDLVFSPDGSLLATYHQAYNANTAPNVAYLWDMESVMEVGTTQQMAGTIWNLSLGGNAYDGLAFSPDGTLLGVTGASIELWDVSSVLEQRVVGSFRYSDSDSEDYDSTALVASYNGFGTIAFSPDGRFIVSEANGSNCYLTVRYVVDMQEYACLGADIPREDPPQSIVFIDNNLLVSGADVPFNLDTLSTNLRLWDVEKGTLIAELEGHFEDLNAIAVSPDRSIIVSGGGNYMTLGDDGWPIQDGALRIWGIPTAE